MRPCGLTPYSFAVNKGMVIFGYACTVNVVVLLTVKKKDGMEHLGDLFVSENSGCVLLVIYHDKLEHTPF